MCMDRGKDLCGQSKDEATICKPEEPTPWHLDLGLPASGIVRK